MANVTIETKVDSAEKLAAIAGKPSENYLLAPEFNQVKDLANKNGVKATTWQTGTVYTEPTCVINDNLLYVLKQGVVFPYTSTDFSAEKTAGDWVAVTVVLPDLPVFEITTPANGQTLVYNSVTGKWENASNFITKKAIVTNASVTGTFNLDASVTDTYNLTLTGNTTLALLNFSSTYAEPMTVYMFGNFAVTYPAGAKVIGTYSTTKTNQLVIEKVGSTTFITVNNYV